MSYLYLLMGVQILIVVGVFYSLVRKLLKLRKNKDANMLSLNIFKKRD